MQKVTKFQLSFLCTSENISAESSKESAKNSAQLSSSRVEKRLPVVKRKEDSCSCTGNILQEI